ncbi:protein of unknown function [Cupriavidus taiwanensis]|nr:protein of unknown function [Cupriavidus taiwanensis]
MLSPFAGRFGAKYQFWVTVFHPPLG